MFDFHTHTFLSDGVLSPIELVRRAIKCGYRVMAITDHVGPGNMEFVLKTLIADCEMVNSRWDILALPGVEITHTPSEDIERLARECRQLGAKVVNVHGETPSEPVIEGTNLAAVSSRHVDILAHPGADYGRRGADSRRKRSVSGSYVSARPQPGKWSRSEDREGGGREPSAGLGRARSNRPAHQGLGDEGGSRVGAGPERGGLPARRRSDASLGEGRSRRRVDSADPFSCLVRQDDRLWVLTT